MRSKGNSTENIEFFIEENFSDCIKNEALPFLDSLRCTHAVASCKGGNIYCETFMPKNDCRGVIVIFHGFCEFCSKYDEFTYYVLKQGFALCCFDHRGHGFSARDIPDEMSKVYIDDFQTYVNDAHTVIAEVVEPLAKGKPLFLFAHSMGGTIGALFLQQYPLYFKAAVLSSPMMMLRLKGIPAWFERIVTKLFRYCKGSKNYIPGQHAFTGVIDFNNERKPSISKERFFYHYNKRLLDERLHTWSGTLSWLDEALDAIVRMQKKKNLSKITTPILLLQAEKDETVLPGGQNKFAAAVPTVKLIVHPDANHELYNTKNDILVAWYKDLFEFYDAYC